MLAVISSSDFIMAGTVDAVREGCTWWSGRWHCRTKTLSSKVELSYFTWGEIGNDPSCFCALGSASSIEQLLLIIEGMWWGIRLLLLADFLNSSLRSFHCLQWQFHPLRNLEGGRVYPQWPDSFQQILNWIWVKLELTSLFPWKSLRLACCCTLRAVEFVRWMNECIALA